MQNTSLLAHAPSFHVPNQTNDSKPEVKNEVEDNSVNEKPETQIQKISSPEMENQVEEKQIEIKPKTVVEEKVVNSVELAQTNNFIPHPGEIVFLLLLTTPFLLFSMKRYIFSQIK
ncbi:MULTISPECIES: hypothetical protein [Okeania]|uniref:Uncharacterized protein n=1 Tax=Okeania hirsuta TaxID=1458930 RepID=A0A3N6PDG8_9CYAN|nr:MULTISPECIES: hypothetical protein [Okeania]NET12564.1 hypothetical protein [Okeania sp. SIO1H6]NES79928.1 hypothetical protein [Okeania sp. SIO1H4]NET20567.1 hypothetical protein [Okeania sp. SIO1H5]NET80346.1 hypothetical protein [Okeania sp. SIO1F9]NET96926.1 hypothetical protein [Okeania sp. SIO1H2]